MIEKYVNYIFLGLIYTFPFITVFGLKLGEIFFNAIFVCSVILLLLNKKVNKPIFRYEKMLFASYVLFNLSCFISIIFAYCGHSYVMRDELILVAIIPIVLVLIRLKINYNLIFYSICLAIIMNFIFAIYQLIVLDIHSEVIGLMKARVLFGDISAILCIFIISIFNNLVDTEKNKTLFMLMVIVLLMSFVSILLSGSRTSWFGTTVALIILFFANKQKIITKSNIFILLLVCLIVALMFIKLDLYNRFYMVYADIKSYSAKGNITGNSLGLRFAVWKEALWMIGQYPYLGIGMNSWRCFISNASNVVVNPDIVMLFHVHSDYLRVFALGGLVTFIPFVVMLVIPFKIFYSSPNKLKYSFYAFQITFMILILPDCLFNSRLFTSFYAYSIAIFLCLLRENSIKKVET